MKKNNYNKGLSFLYNTLLGRIILKPLVQIRFVSYIFGKLMDLKISVIFIRRFVNHNNIDLSLYENKKYNSFNDFFTRKLKKESINIDMCKNSFISPCDGYLTCYKIKENLVFNIKGSKYNVNELIKDIDLSKQFEDGYVFIFRLTPSNYHRYCFIDDGVVLRSYFIKGKFHTVNPIVYDKYKVFHENTRCITLFKSDNFNELLQIEVGALLVGKITNNGVINAKKGCEKGYFEFGGSTIIILVKKNIIEVRKDILMNSKNNKETSVKLGEKIAGK